MTFLKITYNISLLFGLVPPYDFKTQKLLFRKVHPVISVVLLLILGAAYIYSEQGTISEVYTYQHIIESVVEAITATLPLFSTMYVIQTGAFKSQHWKKLLKGLQGGSESFPKVVSLVTLLYVLPVFIMAYNMVDWLNMFGLNELKYYFLSLYMYLVPLNIIYLSCILGFLIKNKSRDLNTLLVEWRVSKGLISSEDCEAMKRKFVDLSNIVDDFNAIFSVPITFILLHHALTILSFFAFMLYHGDSFHYDARVYIGYFIYSSFCLVVKLYMIFCLDGTNDVLDKTGTLFFNLLYEHPNDSEVRVKLYYLALRASRICPEISAGYMRKVSVKVLIHVLNSLATYIIVLIQFITL